MKIGETVQWHGHPVMLTKFVASIGINMYFMAVMLYRPDQKEEMISFRKKGYETDFTTTTYPSTPSSQKERAKRKRATWLDCPVKHLRRKHRHFR